MTERKANMKVLITDKVAGECIEELRKFKDIKVDLKTGISEEEIISIIGGYQALIVRSATKVTKDVINAAGELKVIGRAGAGVDNIDVNAATEKGIWVMNTPGGNSSAVAELALGMMFALARHIAKADASMKASKWEKKIFSGTELTNKTLGLLGIGNVGSIVGRKAKALGMEVLAHDPYIPAEKAAEMGFTMVTQEELYKKCDYISIHMPKTAETTGAINKNVLAKMKDGVFLINCARGGIVVEKDLLEALNNGKVKGAGVDVFEAEPPANLSLVKHPNVVATPHIGASTAEAQVNVAVMIARQVGDLLTKNIVVNTVNSIE
jgi:D-3-phosphoglycerate dehydrogenase / 2-oxoglutarate reductase